LKHFCFGVERMIQSQHSWNRESRYLVEPLGTWNRWNDYYHQSFVLYSSLESMVLVQSMDHLKSKRTMKTSTKSNTNLRSARSSTNLKHRQNPWVILCIPSIRTNWLAYGTRTTTTTTFIPFPSIKSCKCRQERFCFPSSSPPPPPPPMTTKMDRLQDPLWNFCGWKLCLRMRWNSDHVKQNEEI